MENHLLREARLKKGWSQQQLANFAGLSLSTVKRAERGEPLRIDSIQRLCDCLDKTPEQLGLIPPAEIEKKQLDDFNTLHIPNQSQHHVMLDNDYLAILEDNLINRWSLYHTGGTSRAVQGLNLLIQHITNCVNLLRGGDLCERALRLLSLAYQLQGSILCDMMCYSEAHKAHRKALLIAKELYDPELISAALAREGITFKQQDSPLEAIAYFNQALETIKHLGHYKLESYILLALSEAQAIAQQSQESWQSICLAEKALEHEPSLTETSLVRVSNTSLTAQKGVNSVILQNFEQAIEYIDTSLIHYDPAFIRGRARLYVQKAEAYFKLGQFDACVQNVQDSYKMARSVGSNIIMVKAKKLYHHLTRSKSRKADKIAESGDFFEEK